MKSGSWPLVNSIPSLGHRVANRIYRLFFPLILCGVLDLSSLQVLATGTIVAWGTNDYEQCTVPPSLEGFSDIAALAGGRYHSIALKTDGTVVPWGGGWGGLIDDLPYGLDNVVAIATGNDHNLALAADGTLTAWGADNYAQCTMVDGMSNVVAIAAARYHSVVLQADGTLSGDGQYVNYTTSVIGGTALASGYSHDLVLKSDGTVVASRGETTAAGTVPEELDNVMAIAAGSTYSLALQSNGVVVAWGDTTLPEDLTNIVAIAAKGSHSLALRSDGTVVAWGSNYYGESTVPAGLSNVTVIAAGIYHSLALGEIPIETGPMLQITGSVSSVTLSWEPDTPGIILQQADSLSTNTVWTDSPGVSTNSFVIPAAQPAGYFRLYIP